MKEVNIVDRRSLQALFSIEIQAVISIKVKCLFPNKQPALKTS